MTASAPGSGAKARRAAVAQAPTGALVYCRVSTRKQVAIGVGLEAQEARCRAHCAAHDWPVLGCFADDGISGREGLDGRPGLAAALAPETPRFVTPVDKGRAQPARGLRTKPFPAATRGCVRHS